MARLHSLDLLYICTVTTSLDLGVKDSVVHHQPALSQPVHTEEPYGGFCTAPSVDAKLNLHRDIRRRKYSEVRYCTIHRYGKDQRDVLRLKL